MGLRENVPARARRILVDRRSSGIFPSMLTTASEPIMTATELQTLEEQVLAWIRAQYPVSTTQLLEEHKPTDESLSGESLRRAVWNLVDRGLVKYDYSWRLSPVPMGDR